MSHSQPNMSPAGTPVLDRTVGELVAENPNLSRVFQAFEIGFCCQGNLTLKGACEQNSLDPGQVVVAIESELSEGEPPLENPARLPLHELADYIVEKHHGFLRRELPRIHAMAERVAQVHGEHTPTLVEVYEVFTGMARELAHHVQKEEAVLFPAIAAISSGESAAMPVGEPIRCMEEEHSQTIEALRQLRGLTNGYTPPPDACNTYRALFAGLAELEEDTHRHIHLENTVLFSGAMERAG